MNWRYARRQAATLGLLMLAIYAVVSIGVDLIKDEPGWVSEWLHIISAPTWWWWAIRRITEDVMAEKTEQVEREARKR